MGKWLNGTDGSAMKLLHDNKSDISVAGIVPSSYNFEVVDFVMPLYPFR